MRDGLTVSVMPDPDKEHYFAGIKLRDLLKDRTTGELICKREERIVKERAHRLV